MPQEFLSSLMKPLIHLTSFGGIFDLEVLDKFAQYFHVGRALQSRKLPGYILAIISYLITYLCSLEIWIILSLWLTFHE
jgi:hypothetical protein